VLEGYPTFYTRRVVPVVLDSATTTKEVKHCWTYFLSKHKPELFELPHLECYSSLGKHGLRYVERYQRNLAGYEPANDVQIPR
jgi:hypothetical protein